MKVKLPASRPRLRVVYKFDDGSVETLPLVAVIEQFRQQALRATQGPGLALITKGRALLGQIDAVIDESVSETLRKGASDRRRVDGAAAAKRSQTWARVALAAVLLADAEFKIPASGRWRKQARAELNARGFDVELAFLKNNAAELRAALDTIKSAAS